MRELSRRFVPLITEPGGGGHAANGRLISSQKMPAVRRVGCIPVREVSALFGVRALGRITWVEADDDDLEVPAWHVRQRLQRRRDAVQRQRAQHRALVIDKRHDHRLAPEIIAKLHCAPGLVLQHCVERHLLIQPLRKRHRFQFRRYVRGNDAGPMTHLAGDAWLELTLGLGGPYRNAECRIHDAGKKRRPTPVDRARRLHSAFCILNYWCHFLTAFFVPWFGRRLNRPASFPASHVALPRTSALRPSASARWVLPARCRLAAACLWAVAREPAGRARRSTASPRQSACGRPRLPCSPSRTP